MTNILTIMINMLFALPRASSGGRSTHSEGTGRVQ